MTDVTPGFVFVPVEEIEVGDLISFQGRSRRVLHIREYEGVHSRWFIGVAECEEDWEISLERGARLEVWR